MLLTLVNIFMNSFSMCYASSADLRASVAAVLELVESFFIEATQTKIRLPSIKWTDLASISLKTSRSVTFVRIPAIFAVAISVICLHPEQYASN